MKKVNIAISKEAKEKSDWFSNFVKYIKENYCPEGYKMISGRGCDYWGNPYVVVIPKKENSQCCAEAVGYFVNP